MATIALAFCIIIFVIGYIFEPRKVNPTTIFFGEWAVILFLAKLNLFSLIEASDYTYKYIFCGCFFFAIGFYMNLWSKKKYFIFRKNNKIINKYTYELNLKILYGLLIITLVFFIIDSIGAINLLLHGYTLEIIRKQAQSGIQYSANIYMNAVRILIASPVSFATVPFAAIEIFKKNKNKFIIVSVLAISILRVIADGGRSPFIFFGLSLVLCFFYQNELAMSKRKKLGKVTIRKLRITKKLKYFVLAAIAGGIFLWIVTLSRSGTNTLKFTYYYFAMEPIMLEKWITITDASKLYGWGMASFNGFFFPLFYVITNVLNVSYPSYWRKIYDLLESTGTNWQIITASGLTANSYVTAFWNLYVDARWVGIILGMFLYGIFVGSVYKKVLYTQNEKDLSIFCLVMLGVFYSFQFMIFENMYYAIGFVLLEFVLYRRIRITEEVLDEGLICNP